jgi:hypothetical protein
MGTLRGVATLPRAHFSSIAMTSELILLGNKSGMDPSIVLRRSFAGSRVALKAGRHLDHVAVGIIRVANFLCVRH